MLIKIRWAEAHVNIRRTARSSFPPWSMLLRDVPRVLPGLSPAVVMKDLPYKSQAPPSVLSEVVMAAVMTKSDCGCPPLQASPRRSEHRSVRGRHALRIRRKRNASTRPNPTPNKIRRMRTGGRCARSIQNVTPSDSCVLG